MKPQEMTPAQFSHELDISAACGDYLRSRFGAHRGHPEWRSMDEAFRAGVAWAQMNNSARNSALEEAAKVVEKLANDKKANQPQQFALDIASDKIRELKS